MEFVCVCVSVCASAPSPMCVFMRILVYLCCAGFMLGHCAVKRALINENRM